MRRAKKVLQMVLLTSGRPVDGAPSRSPRRLPWTSAQVGAQHMDRGQHELPVPLHGVFKGWTSRMVHHTHTTHLKLGFQSTCCHYKSHLRHHDLQICTSDSAQRKLFVNVEANNMPWCSVEDLTLDWCLTNSSNTSSGQLLDSQTPLSHSC